VERAVDGGLRRRATELFARPLGGGEGRQEIDDHN
jgi:hypothetical protein